jgi:DtxR family transcriptional regulator, Mn-dependent transcriptional regulator
MASLTEENYLKIIFHLSSQKNGLAVTTNEIAESLQNRAATVTDMMKKLAEKQYIDYKKYQGVTLTDMGRQIALKIIRKHRLWEVFLVDKLGFGWDEIHEIAEELEHIESVELTDRLEIFLGHPKFDPHGDPIPDKTGKMSNNDTMKLSEAPIKQKLRLMGVSEDSASFLQHLDRIQMGLGTRLEVLSVSGFDRSIEIGLDEQATIFISHDVAKNLLVSFQ